MRGHPTLASRALGIAIRKRRKAIGLSQEALAYDAECDRTYIIQLEGGRRSPTLDVLYALSGALGLSLQEFAAAIDVELHTLQADARTPER